jgi:serine/threonine protein kinase
MTDGQTSGKDNEALSEELLAELERRVENSDSGRTPDSVEISLLSDAGFCSEHRRLYEFVDKLATPVRFALCSDETPPDLPEYDLLEEIGRGGMGIVYRGTHKRLQRVDAIKIIRPDRMRSVSADIVLQMQHRFERELRLAANVPHEHIVPVYQVGKTDRSPWFSMQFVNGTTLHQLSRSNVPAPERIAGYIEKIARAVHAVHRRGILHGDIKPQNILIETETDRPLLGDFGLAEFVTCDPRSVSTGIAGTLAYMAPEMAEVAMRNASAEEVAATRTVSSDIYSIGATLWAALNGDSPLSRPNFADLSSAERTTVKLRTVVQSSRLLPEGLLQICRKAMADDPGDRHASAEEFADAVASWLNRPHWNRFFPGLQHLLWMVVAPLLLASGVVVWLLLHVQAFEPWIWLAIFLAYVPLFATFAASQASIRSSESARRELWSIWTGHAIGSLACLISLRVLFHPDHDRAIAVFYPCWAVISSVALFAKSGNFWAVYRWIAAAWAIIAVLLACVPSVSPITFGGFAALTCIIIARGDREFRET